MYRLDSAVDRHQTIRRVYTSSAEQTRSSKVKAKFYLRTAEYHQIRCHTILLADRHKRARPALTLASKAGT